MMLTVDGHHYRYGFRYEPDWEPDAGVLRLVNKTPAGRGYLVERTVRGRTLCTITEIRPAATCPVHVGRQKDVPCTCAKVWSVTGSAYCSTVDTFTHDAGRRYAFQRALELTFPYEVRGARSEALPVYGAAEAKALRRAFWAHFLGTITQTITVPARTIRRKLDAATLAG